jgi:hypothetical protein
MEIGDMLYLKLVMSANNFEFYNELHNYFMSRDIRDFNARLIPITNIKTNMTESCKKSWLLFFEDNISKFMKRYPRKLAYNEYVKFCKDENYFPFSNTKFGVKLKNILDVHKTTMDYKTIRYSRIKHDVKARYDIEELELNDEDEILDE